MLFLDWHENSLFGWVGIIVFYGGGKYESMQSRAVFDPCHIANYVSLLSFLLLLLLLSLMLLLLLLFILLLFIYLIFFKSYDAVV